jgi:hypothetical protein
MEEVASKVAGGVKNVKATIEGLSGVFKQLTQEHGELSALLMRVKLSTDINVRRELFPTIRTTLLGHERGEVREVYPAFTQHPDLAPMVQTHQAEAGQIERILDELSATDYGEELWMQRFNDLVTLVNHHVGEEENDYFPAANRVLGKDEAERLKGRYLTTKNEVIQQQQQS